MAELVHGSCLPQHAPPVGVVEELHQSQWQLSAQCQPGSCKEKPAPYCVETDYGSAYDSDTEPDNQPDAGSHHQPSSEPSSKRSSESSRDCLPARSSPGAAQERSWAAGGDVIGGRRDRPF